MKEISKLELAICKKTAQNTKSLRAKKEKLMSKIKELSEDITSIDSIIESFEAPIKIMTEGYTSYEVLKQLNKLKEVVEESIPESIEENRENVNSNTENSTEESTLDSLLPPL